MPFEYSLSAKFREFTRFVELYKWQNTAVFVKLKILRGYGYTN